MTSLSSTAQESWLPTCASLKAGKRGACISIRSLYSRWAKKTLRCVKEGGLKKC
jgi:hypothetical protein